jgi:hypothetical protein
MMTNMPQSVSLETARGSRLVHTHHAELFDPSGIRSYASTHSTLFIAASLFLLSRIADMAQAHSGQITDHRHLSED